MPEEAADGSRSYLLALTKILQLERKARAASSVRDLGFLIVNETLSLLPYRQAALWRSDGQGRGAIVALSGVAVLDPHAPYALWLNRVLRSLRKTCGEDRPGIVDATTLAPELGRDWAQWLPPYALQLPLPSGAGRPSSGMLFLAREEPWTEPEIHLLSYVVDAYGHAWAALSRRRTSFGRATRRGRIAAGLIGSVLLVAAGALPVPQSALAPAEVIARTPSVVRAPIDGVVDRFEVRPNQQVTEGQVLLLLDRTRLQNRLDVARKALEVAEAEHRQGQQQALNDPRAKANLSVLKGRMDQQAAEAAYVEELLTRVEIRAPRSGVAIFDDVNDWIGKPVSIGERILTVAAPDETEVEIRLPVGDALPLPEGAEVRLFLNIDPQHPVPARLTFAGYQPDLTPEGVLAYRLKAGFAEGVRAPRIGLKGTAKIIGDDGPLALMLLRRPLASLRQRLGL